MVRYGPAGWDYKDWAGVVYPKPKPRGFDPLAFLARYFATIEVNSSFYRPIPPESARAWVDRVAVRQDFLFTAKLWRRFTHERGSAWTREEVKEVRQGFDVLARAGRLGAVLMQFPWSFRRDPAAEEWLSDLIDELRDYPLVLEVRHASWNAPEVYSLLAERGVGFTNLDQPLFKRSLRPSARVTSAVGYVRIHGRNYRDWFRKGASVRERYDYLYTDEELRPWGERVKIVDAVAENTFAVTNNHSRGKAPANALMLQSLVEDRPVACPASLVAAYPQVLGPHVLRQEGSLQEEQAR